MTGAFVAKLLVCSALSGGVFGVCLAVTADAYNQYRLPEAGTACLVACEAVGL